MSETFKIGTPILHEDMCNHRPGYIVGIVDEAGDSNKFTIGAKGMVPAGAEYLVVYGKDDPLVDGDSVSQLSHSILERDVEKARHDPISEQAAAELLELARARQAKVREQIRQSNEKAREAREAWQAEFDRRRPDWAKAVIVAEEEIDDCDVMTDYFHTKTGKVLILAWSKHDRDLFPELRKAAALAPETAHLGPGKDRYTVIANKAPDDEERMIGYHRIFHDDDGRERVFTTRAEAEAAVKKVIEESPEAKPDYVGAVGFAHFAARYGYEIHRESIEHREKYSMGAGYYLKAAMRYSSGWTVRKRPVEHCPMGEFRLAERSAATARAATPAAVGEITVTENEDKNGVEIRFPDKPAEDVRECLKAHGFRWSRFSKCWYKRRSAEALEFANSLK